MMGAIEDLKERAAGLRGVPDAAMHRFLQALNSMAHGNSSASYLYDVVDDVCHAGMPPRLSPRAAAGRGARAGCCCFRAPAA